MRVILYRDIYEVPELHILDRTLEPNDRVLEIGGGAGFVSVFLARRCGNDNVTVVEANPSLATLIERNHHLNGVSPRLINAAAVEHDRETETFYLTADFWSGSTAVQTLEQANVPAINANKLIAEIDPTYLIIDIEGAEVDVVPVLNLKNVQKVLLEVHPKDNDVTAANDVVLKLFQKGFVLDFRRLIRNQLYFVRRDQQDILQH